MTVALHDQPAERLSAEPPWHAGPVGFFTPAWPVGESASGIATYTELMSAALRRMRVPVCVLTHRLAGDCGDGFVRRVGGDGGWMMRLVDSIAGRIWPDSWWIRRWGRQIAAAAERLRREGGLTLLEMEESFGTAAFVARRTEAAVVVRLHGPWVVVGRAQGVSEDERFWRRVEAEGEGLKAAAAVTAPSADVLRRVREHYGLELKGAAVIPNPAPPVDERRRWRLEQCERGRVVFVGRFDRCKGADVLLDAFAKVLRRRPGAKLTFVGPDGGLMEDGRTWHLEEYARRRLGNGADAVENKGRQSLGGVNELRRRGNVVVVCSRYETFGLTAVEAMAMGCPLVATAVGGLREIVEDGTSGLLCPAEDAEGLAEGMLRVMEDDDLARRLGEGAAAACQSRFDADVLARRMAEVYGRVVGGVTNPETRSPKE